MPKLALKYRNAFRQSRQGSLCTQSPRNQHLHMWHWGGGTCFASRKVPLFLCIHNPHAQKDTRSGNRRSKKCRSRCHSHERMFHFRGTDKSSSRFFRCRPGLDTLGGIRTRRSPLDLCKSRALRRSRDQVCTRLHPFRKNFPRGFWGTHIQGGILSGAECNFHR